MSTQDNPADPAAPPRVLAASAGQIALAGLFLQALDLAYRHDLRPKHGALAEQGSLAARYQVALDLVELALGDTHAPPLPGG